MEVKRGELWTVAGGTDFLSKPRPAVVIQSDGHQTDDSVTVIPLTSVIRSIPKFRARIDPDERNGLLVPSEAMADRITTVRRARLGRRIGQINEHDLTQIEAAVMEFLGISRG